MKIVKSENKRTEPTTSRWLHLNQTSISVVPISCTLTKHRYLNAFIMAQQI